MKKISAFLIISVLINIVLFTFSVRLVNGMGGLAYFKSRAKKKMQKSYQNAFSYRQKVSIFNNLPHRSNEIIFIGDSNIQYGEWSDLLENNQIRNRGISGDDIEGVTARLNDVLSDNPKKIFLMVGINDLINKHDDERNVVSGYENLVKQISLKSPGTKLYVHSLLPTHSQEPGINKQINYINGRLKQISKDNNVNYIDLYSSFQDANGNLSDQYSFDGIHLNGVGYGVWKKHIEKFVKR